MVNELARDPERLKSMGAAARERVSGASWDKAFDQVYVAYEHCRRISAQAAAAPEALVAKAGM